MNALNHNEPLFTAKPITDPREFVFCLATRLSTPLKAAPTKEDPVPSEPAPKKTPSRVSPTKSATKPATPAKIDEYGFVDSIEDFEGESAVEMESKKRKRESTGNSDATKKPETIDLEEASSPTRKSKVQKTSESTAPSSSAASPAKAKKSSTTPSKAAKQKGTSKASTLSTVEALNALGVPTLGPEDVKVIYASYGNYMQRNGPPLHGEKTPPKGTPDCLASFVFVITGVMESLEREEATELITSMGGTVSKTLGVRVTHAIVGTDAGPAKVNQITDRKIPMISEDGLFTLIRKLSGEEEEGEDGGDDDKGDGDAKGKIGGAKNNSFSEDSFPSIATSSLSTDTSLEIDSKSSTTTIKSKSPTKATATTAAKKASAPVSLTVTLPSPVNPRISTMWTDKYSPVSSSDLVGNPGNVTKLKAWLNSWSSNYEKARDSTDASTGKSTFAFPRGALLMGPPGVGKTCTALIIAKECGYLPIHLNASDQRSQKTLREKVSGLLSNHGINEFFSAASTKRAKTVLLMDEIDGMSTGDRGGMAELTLMIKSTKVPIIAMANDKQRVRSLAQSNHVLPLGFSRPTLQQTFARIASIAANEGLTTLSESVLRRIVESCQGDLRMTLNALQLISANPGALSGTSLQTSQDGSAVDQHLKSSFKDVTLGPFDVVPKIFGVIVDPKTGKGTSPFEERLEHYFVDYSIVPLFVFQNYLRTKIRGPMATIDKKQTLAELRAVRLASESMCDADVIGASIFSKQNFALLPTHGVLSTMRPAAILNAHGTAVEFPAILGKGSSQRKRFGLLEELSAEMHSTTGGADGRGIGLDYLPMLTHRLTDPLIKQEQAGIPEVLQFMNEYGISKDGRDSVLELCELKREKKTDKTTISSAIPAATKAAFTRAYNAAAHIVKIKRKKQTGSEGDAEDEEAILDDADATAAEDEEVNEEQELENDTLVSIAKPKKAKASGAKTTASKTPKKGGDGEEAKSPKAKRAKSTGTK